MNIYWPALIVGIILLIYWVRVLIMVRKTKKEAGHHANFIPEEKLGRLIRVIWMPLVALWVLLPLIFGIGLLQNFFPLRPGFTYPGAHLIVWIATAIAIVAFIITWICWIKMGKSWRMGIDPNEKTQLVLSGPYGYVRHPIYGLSQLLVLMTMIILPSPAMIVVGVLHILLMQWEVRREDAYLVATHGEPYAKYKQNVGRFLPRSLRPYQP